MNNEVIKLGQIHVGDSQSGYVYSGGGISPTIIAGTHGYAIGYVLEIRTDRQDMFLSGR